MDCRAGPADPAAGTGGTGTGGTGTDGTGTGGTGTDGTGASGGAGGPHGGWQAGGGGDGTAGGAGRQSYSRPCRCSAQTTPMPARTRAAAVRFAASCLSR
jgi:hypothetical protein